MTIYKRSGSLTIEEMAAIKKWLRLAYRLCQGNGNTQGQSEILRLGIRLGTCINAASAHDAN